MLVVPRDEQLEFVPELGATYRDQQATCSLSLHGADEPLDDRDAAMLPDGSIPRPDLPSAAPGFEAAAPELTIHQGIPT